VSDAKKLGVRMPAVSPRPIDGMAIGARVPRHKQRDGRDNRGGAFIKKVGVSLDKVASGNLTALDGGVSTEINAIAMTPAAIESLT
jgi:hypothetical protein